MFKEFTYLAFKITCLSCSFRVLCEDMLIAQITHQILKYEASSSFKCHNAKDNNFEEESQDPSKKLNSLLCTTQIFFYLTLFESFIVYLPHSSGMRMEIRDTWRKSYYRESYSFMVQRAVYHNLRNSRFRIRDRWIKSEL